MSDSSWCIRPATAEDGEFLADMLVEAVNWSPEWKPKSRRRVLSDPRTARYIAAWRGRGVGRDLLRAIAALAAQAGIGRISLSVERKNFARGLYLSEGFTVVDASDPQSDTMVKKPHRWPAGRRRQGA
jgi:GNAT superfamily N-acetyltransferase